MKIATIFAATLTLANVVTMAGVPQNNETQLFPEGTEFNKTGFVKARQDVKFLAKPRMARTPEEEMIWDRPEGEMELCKLSASGFIDNWGSIQYGQNSVAAEVIYAEDDVVYLQNPVSFYHFGTYIKGVKEGNRVKVELPQCIGSWADWEGNEGGLYLNKMYFVGSVEDGWFYTVPENNVVYYNIGEDNSLTLDFDDEVDPTKDFNWIMGMTYDNNADDEGSWTGFGDYEQVYAKFTEVPATPTEGAQIEDNWVMKYGYNGASLNVAFSDTQMFIEGVFPNYPDSWIVGDKKGDSYVFKGKQYMGLNGANFIYVMIGRNAVIQTDWGEYDGFEFVDEVEVAYDSQTKKLIFPENIAILLNSGTENVVALSNRQSPEIFYQSPDTQFGAPVAPIITMVQDYVSDWGYGYVNFKLPPFDEQGNYLNVENMFYNMYVDGEMFVFYSDEYRGLEEEETTDIPYTFTAKSWNIIGDQGASHMIRFSFQDASLIGFRSCYVNDEGEVLASNIVNYDMQSGISNLDADKEVKNVYYVSLTGMRIETPTPGQFFIKVTEYSDGTRLTSKVIK